MITAPSFYLRVTPEGVIVYAHIFGTRILFQYFSKSQGMRGINIYCANSNHSEHSFIKESR